MYNPGDVVCYSAAFLRSVGWHTDVPENGKVMYETLGSVCMIRWCDGSESAAANKNLILYSKRHLEAN